MSAFDFPTWASDKLKAETAKPKPLPMPELSFADEPQPVAQEQQEPKRRGRPAGSKNVRIANK